MASPGSKGIRFTDLRPTYVGSHYYIVPNESVNGWIHLVESLKTRFKHAGSICSGGEVPLLVLLPFADKVTAIDHSYKSLAIAISKVLLLRNHTADQLIQMNKVTLNGLITEFQKDLPESLRCFNIANDLCCESGSYGTVTGKWRKIGLHRIDAIRERLDDIDFIHGDLRDLPRVDCIYTSNAAGHERHDKAPSEAFTKDVCRSLVSGGHLLSSHAVDNESSIKLVESFWRCANNKDIPDDGGMSSWEQTVYLRLSATQVSVESVLNETKAAKNERLHLMERSIRKRCSMRSHQVTVKSNGQFSYSYKKGAVFTVTKHYGTSYKHPKRLDPTGWTVTDPFDDLPIDAKVTYISSNTAADTVTFEINYY
jgi:hypothetical protein